MTQTVVQIKKERINDFKNRLLEKSSIQSMKTTNPYEVFRVKYLDVYIIGYTTGKVVITGDKGKKIVSDIIEEMESGIKDYDILIGSDEAGKGEWLGPLTIAAIALTPRDMTTLRIEGVMDSKDLRIKRIFELVDTIKKNCKTLSIITISPQRFNEFFREIKQEGKSLNDILAWGHSKAIDEVYSKIGGDKNDLRIKVIIDEFDKIKTEDRIQRVISFKNITLIQKPKAEEEMAVAAASILAKATREEWIDRESKRLNINLRKISPPEARNMKNVNRIAKISYLQPIDRNSN